MGSAELPQNTWWIEPDRVLMGPYPGHKSNEFAIKKIRSLLELNTRAFICLTSTNEKNSKGELLKPYAHLISEAVDSIDQSASFVQIPIAPHAPVSKHIIKSVLSSIKERLDKNHIVYVHDLSGHGRVGLIGACWLMRQPMFAEDALVEIHRLLPQKMKSSALSKHQTASVLDFGAFEVKLPDWNPDGTRGIRRMLEMLQELHSRGYQRLRVWGIGAWHGVIAPASAFSKDDGSPLEKLFQMSPAVHSTSMEWNICDLGDCSGKNPRRLADEFVRKYEGLATLGRGNDPQYVQWFEKMMRASAPYGYPSAETTGGNSDWTIVNSTEAIPAPPLGTGA